jgi:Protein required for attachment to host cells
MLLLPEAKRTWVVMLHGARASVFESESPGGCFTRVQTFARGAKPRPAAAARPELDERAFVADIAHCLEDARDEHRYDRLMVVGAEEGLKQLLGAVSPPTRALVAAKRVEDLSGVQPEDLRWYVPAGASS